MKEKLISALEQHAGRRVCGDTQSEGAPSPDLTITELQEYVRPFHPTPAESERFERAWTFAQMWLRAEGVLTQNYNRDLVNPYERVLIVNEDSYQPLRFRAVYPSKPFTCRWREQLGAHWLSILFWSIVVTMLVHVAMAVQFWLRWRALVSRLSPPILSHLRSDVYVDVDAGVGTSGSVRSQQYCVEELREEFLPKLKPLPADASLFARLAHHTTLLLHTLAWQSVYQRMMASSEVEKGREEHWKWGHAITWRWIGERGRGSGEQFGGAPAGARNNRAAATTTKSQSGRGGHAGHEA